MGNVATKKKIKKAATDVGKNIRVSIEAWNSIRMYCHENSLVMGGFVERAAIEKIEQSKKK